MLHRLIRRGARRGPGVPMLLALLFTAVPAAGLAAAPAAVAKAPAADCQPYSGKPCLFPYPDNRLTRPDRASRTRLRVNLPAAAMPVNTKGARIATGPYDGNDGFSPGSAIVLHVPGLTSARALRRTGAAPLTDEAKSKARRAPVVVIDQATGRRQLIWVELDANAKGAANTDLLIHPAADLTEGHTYIVALRNLRTAAGRLIEAPSWFARLRAGGRLPAALRRQKKRYKTIFKALKRAGIAANAGLYEAWNFTVESRQSLTGRMLAIRNNAFAQLGDANLADGRVSGRAPAFTVLDTKPLASSTGVLTQVDGTVQVPCYLVTCGPSTQPGFHYSKGACTRRRPRHRATWPPHRLSASSPRRPPPPIRRGSRCTATACSAPATRSTRPPRRRWPPRTTWSCARPTSGVWPAATPSTTPPRSGTSTGSARSSTACSRRR